jgi:hypothetical protein
LSKSIDGDFECVTLGWGFFCIRLARVWERVTRIGRDGRGER